MITMISNTPSYSTYSESVEDFCKRAKAEKPFSDARKMALEVEAKAGAAECVAAIQTNPQFADQMASTYTFLRDFEVVDLAEVIKQDPTELELHNQLFEAQANEIMMQRIEIYNRMKANGSSGASIFKNIMAFNKTLPEDYQKATRLNIIANAAIPDSTASSTVDFTSITPNELGQLVKSGRFPELPSLVLPKKIDLTKETNLQIQALNNAKVNYIDLIQKQIEFDKSIGKSTTHLDSLLNLMQNFNA
jgi:hypothetical protein